VKQIGIFCKKKPPVDRQVLQQLVDWLSNRNYEICMDSETAGIIGQTSTCSKEEIPARSDLIIVLGGDGTLLGMARIAHSFNVPILAINLGSLGFLTDVPLPGLLPALEKVLGKNYKIENRMLLNATLLRNGQTLEEHNVLNDLVINKGALARIVELHVSVNGEYMTSYRGDGLIVATPTGSTAYSLSAGGPIIHPSMHNLVISPICPFALTNRPIVLPDDSLIEIKLQTNGEHVRLTLDGQEGCDMDSRDLLRIRKGQTTLKLVRVSGISYYELLREKLHWGSTTLGGGTHS